MKKITKEALVKHLSKALPNTSFQEDRILQVTNDVSEDMCTAKREELLEIIKWWSGKYAEVASELARYQDKDTVSKAHKKALRKVVARLIALDCDGECDKEDTFWHQEWQKAIANAKSALDIGKAIDGL